MCCIRGLLYKHRPEVKELHDVPIARRPDLETQVAFLHSRDALKCSEDAVVVHSPCQSCEHTSRNSAWKQSKYSLRPESRCNRRRRGRNPIYALVHMLKSVDMSVLKNSSSHGSENITACNCTQTELHLVQKYLRGPRSCQNMLLRALTFYIVFIPAGARRMRTEKRHGSSMPRIVTSVQ